MFDETGQVIQDQSYYPFGMSMGESLTFDMPSSLPDNKYLYNGKEIQMDFDLGWYDYGARFYDPALGRWHVLDPLAEEAYSWTPFRYGFNNPLSYTDPTGMLEDWVEKDDGTVYWDDKATSQETTKKGETYLGENVVVLEGASVDENGNVDEDINEATISLYTPENKEGPTATMEGNTVSADGDKYATVAEGTMDGKKTTYKGTPAILINDGGKVPTTKENPNPESDYHGQKFANEILLHAGNKNYRRLTTSEGKAISEGCQTGCSGDRTSYLKFMKKVPANTNIKIVLKRNK